MDLLKYVDFLTTDTAEAIYKRHEVDGTWGWIRHDVDVYASPTTTRDTDDRRSSRPARSSSRRASSGHGPCATAAARSSPGAANATHLRITSVRDQGRLRRSLRDVVPRRDVRGGRLSRRGAGRYRLWATKGLEHPYLHAKSLAWTSLDMLRAAREFAGQKKRRDGQAGVHHRLVGGGTLRHGPAQADRGTCP